MEKTRRQSTKAVKTEKNVGKPTLVASPSTNLKEAAKKQVSSKDSSIVKTAGKVEKSAKPLVLQKSKPQVTAAVTKSTVKTNTTEKPQNSTIKRAKNIPKKDEVVARKQITSTTAIQKRTKPNAVLDTFHNVTVSSPPTPRKNTPISKDPELIETASSSKRTRTQTRTLQPEEVVVLRNESAKQRIEAEIQAVNNKNFSDVIKDSVAFEINFESDSKVSLSAKKSETNENKTLSETETNYSDDFESYESDFESESLSASTNNSEEINIDENQQSAESSQPLDDEPDDEESELTQNAITVIQRDSFLERNFDSGHYDMNLRVQENMNEVSLATHQQNFDSLDTFSGTTVSEQPDSGISSCRLLINKIDEKIDNISISYGGYKEFISRPVLTARGSELMSKIKFDTLLFSFFELKPISYETFMQTYGKLNTTQSFTQTKDNYCTSDSQTDECVMRSNWTQHPPKFDAATMEMQMRSENYTKQASGSSLSHRNFNGAHRARNINSVFSKSTDFRRLHMFLVNSANLVSKVLGTRQIESNIQKGQLIPVGNSSTGLSTMYTQLNTNFLNALRVVHVFANSKHNLVITVHESLPEADVYSCEFSNLLMVWSINDSTKPMRLLSTWSKVCRVEISNEIQDIIVCGLCDGSIAMWDLRETYSFCSKLDGHLTHFAATQSIAPISNESSTAGELVDLGAVIDIKSFLSRRKLESFANSNPFYKTIQFTSLNDSGIIVVWTLVEVMKSDGPFDASSQLKEKTKHKNVGKDNARLEYSSPWARVKLVQSAACDLRSYLESDILKVFSSNFERARFLFEKNIYKDDILRELNKTTSLNGNSNKLQGLRFSSLAAGYDSIYVCTNQSFVLICSKSLKTNKFRKIFIDESRFLFPTALKLLRNEEFLAVGLSNGSVMIINCKQRNFEQQTKKSKQLDDACLTENKRATHLPKESLDIDLETGKSCTIQNIILNERNSFEQYDGQENSTKSYPRLKVSKDLQSSKTKQNLFETRVLDQQMLLSGCMLRKHLVQSLELSSDGCRLFALSDGEIRCFDFSMDREATFGELVSLTTHNSKIINIAIAQTSIAQQYLILLTNENVVKMHVLKQ